MGEQLLVLQPLSRFRFHFGGLFIIPGLRTSPSSWSPSGGLAGAQTGLANERIKLISFIGPLCEPGLGWAFSYVIAFIKIPTKDKPSRHFLHILWKSRCEKTVHDRCLPSASPALCFPLLLHIPLTTWLLCEWRSGRTKGIWNACAFWPSHPLLPTAAPEGVHPARELPAQGLLQDPLCALLWAPSRNGFSPHYLGALI